MNTGTRPNRKKYRWTRVLLWVMVLISLMGIPLPVFTEWLPALFEFLIPHAPYVALVMSIAFLMWDMSVTRAGEEREAELRHEITRTDVWGRVHTYVDRASIMRLLKPFPLPAEMLAEFADEVSDATIQNPHVPMTLFDEKKLLKWLGRQDLGEWEDRRAAQRRC